MEAAAFPDCMQPNVVLRHAGAHVPWQDSMCSQPLALAFLKFFLDFLGLQVLQTEVVGRLSYAACVLNNHLIGLALQLRQFLLTLALTELQAW